MAAMRILATGLHCYMNLVVVSKDRSPARLRCTGVGLDYLNSNMARTFAYCDGMRSVVRLAFPAACHNGRPVLRRAFQVALLVAYVLLVGTWLWFGHGPSLQSLGRSDLSSAAAMILWLGCPALTIFLLQTSVGTIFTGLTLLVANTVALNSIYSSDHSTAGIGLFTLPLLMWLIALALLASESMWRKPWLV